MIYDWYRILNVADFEADGVPSRELVLELTALGQKTVVVTKGNFISILYNDIFLTVDLNGQNPFEFEDHAAYVDGSGDLFLGIKAAQQ